MIGMPNATLRTISRVSLPLAGRGQGWGVPYALTDELTL